MILNDTQREVHEAVCTSTSADNLGDVLNAGKTLVVNKIALTVAISCIAALFLPGGRNDITVQLFKADQSKGLFHTHTRSPIHCSITLRRFQADHY